MPFPRAPSSVDIATSCALANEAAWLQKCSWTLLDIWRGVTKNMRRSGGAYMSGSRCAKLSKITQQWAILLRVRASANTLCTVIVGCVFGFRSRWSISEFHFNVIVWHEKWADTRDKSGVRMHELQICHAFRSFSVTLTKNGITFTICGHFCVIKPCYQYTSVLWDICTAKILTLAKTLIAKTLKTGSNHYR